LIYFHKVVPLFFSPISFILIFFLLFFIFKNFFFIYFSFFLILFFTNSFFANKFFSYIENTFPILEIDNLPTSDGIVVLSGMISKINKNNMFYNEWNDPDRFFAGIKLIENNKSEILVFTNALLPWEKNSISEGEILKQKAMEAGIPENKLFLTEIIYNTEDESKSLNNILKKKSEIILVTSAFHMLRAKYLFEKEDYLVTPFPVDFKVIDTKTSFFDFLPNIYALELFSLGIRELYGRIYYFYLYDTLRNYLNFK
jgi:uncharacterized SAM-binding protein YcdF (DUF218 family)